MSFKNPDRLKKKKNKVYRAKPQSTTATEKVTAKAKKPKKDVKQDN